MKLARILLLVITLLLSACASTEKKSDNAPDAGALNVKAAKDLMQQGNPELALKKVLLALEQNPDLASAYDVAGRIYEQSGQSELAEKYLIRASTLDPKNEVYLNDLGKFLCKHRRFNEAEEKFLLVTESKATHARGVAYTNAAVCMLQKPDQDRAAQYLRAALDADPTIPTASYQLAKINFEKERYPQAQRYLNSYLQNGDHTAKTLWLGMRIARSLGNEDEFLLNASMLQSRFPASQEAAQAAIYDTKKRGGKLINPKTVP